MKLKDLCILDVACCTPDLTIAAAAHIMRQRHTGDLVVRAADSAVAVADRAETPVMHSFLPGADRLTGA